MESESESSNKSQNTEIEIRNVKKVMVICLGNICRSPVCEFLLRKYALLSKKENIKAINFDSAGIIAGHRGRMYHKSNKYLKNSHNIDTSKFRTKGIGPYLKDFEIIIVLEENMISDIASFTTRKQNIGTLSDFAGEKGDIIDPYYENSQEYARILGQMDELCRVIIERWDNKS